jgi:hypothetical protein
VPWNPQGVFPNHRWKKTFRCSLRDPFWWKSRVTRRSYIFESDSIYSITLLAFNVFSPKFLKLSAKL